jgi:hypothetical protein
MNWYKKAIYQQWDDIFKELAIRLGRKPTSKDVQEEIMRKLFPEKEEEKALDDQLVLT